jgi:hypothetical protein
LAGLWEGGGEWRSKGLGFSLTNIETNY